MTPWTAAPPRLLCPWDFLGKNTKLVCHFLFQGIFQTQGSNPRLLHWRILTHWTIREAPVLVTTFYQIPLLNHITFLSFALVTLSSFMKEGKSESHSVVSATPWTVTAFSRLFCLWNFPGKILEWVVIPFSRGIFSMQGSNLGLLHCRWTQTIVWATREGFMDLAK